MSFSWVFLIISTFVVITHARAAHNKDHGLRAMLAAFAKVKVNHQKQLELKHLGQKMLPLRQKMLPLGQKMLPLGARKEGLSEKSKAFLLREEVPDSCTAEYAAMDTSTMCVYFDDPDATNTGISDADKQIIVDEHNKYRSGVSPTATNMFKAYWDDNIAVIAQKYAQVCPTTTYLGHDENDERKVPGYGITIGQNLAWGYGNWAGAIKGWYDEVEAFTYGGPNTFGNIGHFTQVVNSDAILIGCGYAECPNTYSRTYACNYAFGQSDSDHPYASGDACADCPDQCSDNLCDCGAKLCLNGGTLDPNTCECDCADPYAGETCSQTDCPAADTAYSCTVWDDSYCAIYSNVPHDCPWLCGICTQEGLSGGDDATDESEEDTEEESPIEDTSDEESPIEESPDEGNDESSEESEETSSCSGPITRPSFCQNGGTANMVTCSCDCANGYEGNRCDTAVQQGCGDMACQNGGSLNEASCTCICSNDFITGDLCQNNDCPSFDTEYSCSVWASTPEYCDIYYNVAPTCPILCGTCPEVCPGISGYGIDSYCQNGGTFDLASCSCDCAEGYNGDQCQQHDSCPVASDPSWCRNYDASYCTYSNLGDYCPWMCEIC